MRTAVMVVQHHTTSTFASERQQSLHRSFQLFEYEQRFKYHVTTVLVLCICFLMRELVEHKIKNSW